MKRDTWADTFDKLMKMKPSERGLELWPETGGYYEDAPCTCLPTCIVGCKGHCDGAPALQCLACNMAYHDFLSLE